MLTYASSTATTGEAKIGIYYIWSTVIVNGGVRVTNTKSRVGGAGQVGGWIKITSIK